MEQNYNHDKITEASSSNLLQLQNRPRKINKDNRIKIDISKTQYPLLRNVATNDLAWRIWTREESKQEINLFWVDTYVSDEQIRRMKTYQRINHFPASENLGKKNLLTNNLNRMKKVIPKQYSFYPQAFNFPHEVEEFQKFSKTKEGKYFIVKPSCDSQGRGIYLTNTVDLSIKEEIVVQEYIENPLLIEGNKFDLRIYVLLRSICPLRIYVYHEGLSRLATCSYQKPSSGNKKNMRMHLTNYAINKFSPNFIFNKSQQQDNTGHKRSYTATMQEISKLGCDINMLQSEIDKIIVKTIMSTYQHLEKKYKEMREIKQQNESICFQILGFDILIKQDFEPLLLQVNHSPSFSTDSPLDMVIKKCLILDTLNLLNLNHEDKIHYFKNKNDIDGLHLYLQTSKNNRSLHIEPEEIGAYRKIYPLDSNHENQQLIKLYDQIFKSCKGHKQHRPHRHIPPLNIKISVEQKVEQRLEFQRELKKSLSTQQQQKSFTLYNVINSLKINRLKKSKPQNVQPFLEENKIEAQKTNIFESDLNAELIRKEQLLSYERKVRKDKQKQKKKYILPMPLNNVNIRLDEKYASPKREAKSSSAYYYNPDQNYFKIHSLFNNRSMPTPQLETERSSKDKGNQTADGQIRQLPHFETFRKTHLAGFSHISDDHAYSIDLKQKLERMQFVRLRIQKGQRLEKGAYVIIKNKSTDKKQASFARD